MKQTSARLGSHPKKGISIVAHVWKIAKITENFVANAGF
jgi:hypothetical protein